MVQVTQDNTVRLISTSVCPIRVTTASVRTAWPASPASATQATLGDYVKPTSTSV